MVLSKPDRQQSRFPANHLAARASSQLQCCRKASDQGTGSRNIGLCDPTVETLNVRNSPHQPIITMQTASMSAAWCRSRRMPPLPARGGGRAGAQNGVHSHHSDTSTLVTSLPMMIRNAAVVTLCAYSKRTKQDLRWPLGNLQTAQAHFRTNGLFVGEQQQHIRNFTEHFRHDTKLVTCW